MAKAGVNVTAIEPSDEMRKHLFESIENGNLKSRIDVIQSEWPISRNLHADVAFASFVIEFSHDPLKFIHAMERSAKNRCVLSVHVDQPLALLKDIWSIFRPDESLPSMLTFPVLYTSMLNESITADVTIIREEQRPSPMMEPDEMISMISELLAIRDKPSEMQRLMEVISIKRNQLQQPHTMRSAIISWAP